MVYNMKMNFCSMAKIKYKEMSNGKNILILQLPSSIKIL